MACVGFVVGWYMRVHVSLSSVTMGTDAKTLMMGEGDKASRLQRVLSLHSAAVAVGIAQPSSNSHAGRKGADQQLPSSATCGSHLSSMNKTWDIFRQA